MTLGWTHRGLDAWTRAVPLPLALPPGDPSGWTCLLALLGPRLAFLPESAWGGALASDMLLRALLERLGHGSVAGVPRHLALVTPIPRDGVVLEDLLAGALTDPSVDDAAARLLAHVGTERARTLLVDHASARADLGMGLVDALGRAGGPPALLARWDGSWDAERLRALVRAGHPPEELPPSLEALGPAFPDAEPDGLREVFESLDAHEGAAAEAVLLLLRGRPDTVRAIADAVLAQLHRAVDLPDLAESVGAAASGDDGEDLLDGLVEQLGAEDWRARMGAAMALGAAGEPRAVDALRGRAADDDPDVRREATCALARLGVDTPLINWTERYGFMERAAKAHPWGAALAGGPVPRSLFALLARRDAPEVLERAALVVALALPDLAAPTLEALAKDGGYEVPLQARQAAAAGLLLTGHAPRDRGTCLRVLLRDLDDQGLGGPLEGVQEGDLVALLAKDGDWQVRLAALGLLGRAGRASAYDALLASVIESDSDNDVRSRASALRAPSWRASGVPEALANVAVGSRVDGTRKSRALQDLERADPGLMGELSAELLDHPDREIAVLAARIAGRSAGDALDARVAWALGALRLPDWIRREAAAALLGSLDPAALDPAVREELLETLESAATDDDDRDVQAMARWAASRLEGAP